MDGSSNMTLCYVCNFVRQNASELVFVASCFEQAGVNANVTARQGERVNSVILDDEESEVAIAVIGLRSDFIADFIDIFVDQWVLDNQATFANVAHDRAPDLCFIIRRKNGVSRATHVRKFDVVCTSAADKYNGGGDNRQQGRFKFGFQHICFDWANPLAFPLFQCFHSVQYLRSVAFDFNLTPFAA